jgi:bacillithiol biosynthesis deacetylase BshB1
MQDVDILAIGVHPDDVELSACGTILRHIQAGYSCGLCDLTMGELGTRGSGPQRLLEAEESRKLMNAAFRVNLGMADGFFQHSEENVRKIIKVIRSCKPKIILANALSDRHPDHARAAKLISDACFYSGLAKIEILDDDGSSLATHRPNAVYHYIQDRNLKPDFVVDITDFMDLKLKCIQAFSSQFYTGDDDDGPKTPISSKQFFDFIKSKNATYARDIQVDYAEAFNVARTPGVTDLFDLQ